MKKGIVLELKKDYAVIGSEKSYKRVIRRESMEIGQEIIYLEDDVLISKVREKYLVFRNWYLH